MAKFIAVCGAPGSGKTSVALKVAQELYLLNNRNPVLFFSPDLQVPSLGYIFPHRKASELYSIGEVLEQTDVYREDVLKHTVTTKDMEGLGYLGFKAGENKYSYPRPTEDKVRQLFRCMRELADYVVVDCSSNRTDLLSAMARNEADTIIHVTSPNLKTMCYYASNSDQFESTSNCTIHIMNIQDHDIYLPLQEVNNHFKGIPYMLPYAHDIKQQATCDNTWTSYNNLYATMYKWNGNDWVPSLSTPDGQDLNEAMINGTTDTVTSSLGYLRITDSYDSGENQIPFNLATAWAMDPNNTTQSDWYSIPIVTPDVELYEIYLVDEAGHRLDHTALTLGETVYIRHKYRNNTDCTLIVDGYNNDREEISVSGVYRIPANSAIVVAAGSFVVTENEFVLWGGVYLEGAGIYNTKYESDGTNNELTLQCNASYPLTLTPIAPNASYREDTDVISSFWLNNGGSTDVTPNSNITIRMQVYMPNGTLITSQTIAQAIVPGKDKNLYYFKWTVPAGLNEQQVQIIADIVDGGESFSLSSQYHPTCVYPQYDTPDTNYEDKAPDGFRVPSTPTATSNYATWWQWEWESDSFVKKNYGIGIPKISNEPVAPDPNSNSTYKNGSWTMKSGYGVWLEAVNSVCGVSGYTLPSSNAYTAPQFTYAAYPEFGYGYGANVCTTLRLQSGYWYFSSPNSPKYHYTPIYFPDGEYVVKIVRSDMWTPAGMISAVSTTAPIIIKDSAYDDWFVGRE